MQNFVSDLRKAPTPEALHSRSPLVDEIKRAHNELLRAMVSAQSTSDLGDTVTDLRRYSLWLEKVGFSEYPDQEYVFNLASTIYEFCGRLFKAEESPNIFVPPLNDLVRSAILSCFTSFQAHSTLIGNRVCQTLKATRVSSNIDECHRLVALTICSLLGRSFYEAFSYSVEMSSLIVAAERELRGKAATNLEIYSFDRAISLAIDCGLAAFGMLTGNTEIVKARASNLEELREEALEDEDARLFWLTDRLHLILEKMYTSHVARVISDARLPRRYISALASDGIFEFWEPQMEAINKGLLDPTRKHNFVISVPTGGGKSLFAELAILNALRDTKSGWAIYVTPSRALVGQVSRDLRMHLERSGITVRTIIAGAEQSPVVLSEELDLLSMAKTVTVLTPEKLDSYYRNNRSIFDTCKVVIFDEVHKVGEEDRGPLLESLVSRFLMLQPETQALMLSGVMTNVAEMKLWLGDRETQTIAVEQRPTRQTYCVAVRTNPTSACADNPSNGDECRVDFEGGLVVVHEASDLEGRIPVTLPNIFQGFYTERYSGLSHRWREYRKSNAANHSSTISHAKSVAKAFLRGQGTVIVFVGQPIWAEAACREFARTVASEDAFTYERLKLSNALASDLGSEHLLVTSCLRGVAYHHSRLPMSTQRTIEHALQNGWIRVLFTTPTLREGVNTSATTVIISGNSFHNSRTGKQMPLAEVDFLNIAGRAGRPRVDTEGRIILVPDSLATAVQTGKKYIIPSDEARRVRSQLGLLATDLGASRSDIMKLSLSHQSLLLGLDAAGVTTPDFIVDFIGHTLWAVQEETKNQQTTVARIGRTLARAKELYGDAEVALAAKLGFSFSSAVQLREKLLSYSDALLWHTDSDEQFRRLLAILLECAFQIDEIKRGFAEDVSDPARHLEPILAWIRGEQYEMILEVCRTTGLLKETAKIEAAVRYASTLSTYLSWALGAINTLLQESEVYIHPTIANLPLLVKYGVPNLVSAYLSLLGVNDRQIAQRLGEGITLTEGDIDLEGVVKWLKADDAEEKISNILSGEEYELHLEIVKGQVFSRKWGRAVYRSMAYAVLQSVEIGAILEPVSQDNRILLRRNNETIGTIRKEADVEWLSARLHTSTTVVVGREGKGGYNRIVAIELPEAKGTNRRSSTQQLRLL